MNWLHHITPHTTFQFTPSTPAPPASPKDEDMDQDAEDYAKLLKVCFAKGSPPSEAEFVFMLHFLVLLGRGELCEHGESS